MLRYLLDQALDFRDFGKISGDSVGYCVGSFVGESVEGGGGGGAGFGFATGDEDFGAAGLEETEGFGQLDWIGLEFGS